MNCFDEPYWNLLQVLTWVWLGDRSGVARASDANTEYGTFFQELRTPDGESRVVETNGSPFGYLTLCLIGAEKGGPTYRRIEAAEREICDSLQSEGLQAFGVANGRGDLTPVPPLEWSRLCLRFPSDGSPPYAEPAKSNQACTVWHNLKFQRAQVVTLWPDPLDAGIPSGSASTKRGPGAPSIKLEAAKVALRERYPNNGVPPREDSNAAIAAQIQEDLSAKGCPTVSARTIDKARRALEDAQK
jgi:hypothetical protein